MTPPIALPSLASELIDKAFAEKATFLDLGNCGLAAILPDYIWHTVEPAATPPSGFASA